MNKFKDSWKVVNIDLFKNDNSHLNIILNDPKNLSKEIQSIKKQVEGFN